MQVKNAYIVYCPWLFIKNTKEVSCLSYLSVTAGLSRVECCTGLSDYRIRRLKDLEDDRDRPRNKSYFGC